MSSPLPRPTRHSFALRALPGLFLAPLIAACDAAPADDAGPRGGDPPAVTYHADIGPLVQQKCLGCHSAGGIAPLSLEDPDDVVALASLLASVTADRSMPPWMPGPRSPALRDDFSLSDEEIAQFQQFAEAAIADPAAARGDPADAPPPVAPIGFPYDTPDAAGTMAEPFVPLGLDTGEDEFRCFVLDLDVPTDRMLIAYRFVPGNALVDHHAILTLYSKDDLAALEALDAASTDADGNPDERPGWSCFGEDVPADVATPVARLGAWTPGNTGVVLYPGTAQPIPRNVVAVASMHYNVYNVVDDDGVDLARAADQSGLELYFAAPEDEDALVRTFSLPKNNNRLLGDTQIPAGDPAFVLETTDALADLAPGARALLENNDIRTVYLTGVGAHGHRLLDVVEVVAHEGTADEQVLLEIPRWDFDWQGQYIYQQAIALDVEAPITVRCIYDNTEQKRAAAGIDPTPAPVTAGEGSGEEMCIVAFSLTVAPPPADATDGAAP